MQPVNAKVNEKKKVIALRAMFKKAISANDFERLRIICKSNKVKYDLLAIMDDATFKRAISEEFDQVGQFFIK